MTLCDIMENWNAEYEIGSLRSTKRLRDDFRVAKCDLAQCLGRTRPWATTLLPFL